MAKFKLPSFSHRIILLAVLLMSLVPQLHVENAFAAACTAPGVDYGQVTGLSTSIANAGTYKIWTRMAAADTSNNTYLLEIDGSSCYTVGGSSVPVYTNGATTYFANNSSNWINTTSAGASISLSLTAGTHTFKLIGNGVGLVIDRLIFTPSTTCVPTGTGANCSDATAPTISAIASTNVVLNSATIGWTTNENASGLVEYGTTTSYGLSSALSSSLTTSHSIGLSSLTSGTTYHYRVTSVDEAGNTTVSADRTFATAATITYLAPDINQDGVVGILDVSLLVAKWNVSGSSASLGRSDINGDGVVNALDLSMLIAQYGQ